MFADVAAARDALSEYFYEESVDMLVGHLLPAIAFEPLQADREPALGATRIGGTPDLPAGERWPVRPVPADADAISARGGPHYCERIGRHLASPRPFEFLAQVDLAEAAMLGAVAADLPSTGRLLFFYDGGMGPWHDGAESCRVVWDTTPVAKLERLPLPKGLIDLHVEEHAHGGYNRYDRSAVNEKTASSYWAPARTMCLRAALQLPDWRSAEAQSDNPFANETLVEALQDEDFEASFLALFDGHVGNGSRHQLLGLPQPEQQDPRHVAVVLTDFGEQHIPPQMWRENRLRLSQGASKWRLLLQIDLKDYRQQQFVEGTVYFLIRRDDLAARAFDKVVAIYQQT